MSDNNNKAYDILEEEEPTSPRGTRDEHHALDLDYADVRPELTVNGSESENSGTSEKNPPKKMEVDTRGFTPFVILSQVLGLLCVLVVAVWMGHYAGGFAWSENPGLQFNYHPLFMVIAFIFLYSDALLVYRVFRNERKRRTKIIHGSLQGAAFIFMVVALKAVFDSHDLHKPEPLPNLYSLHSWVGLCTVLLFCAQWVLAFITFVAPGLNLTFRQFLMPLHVFFGLGILAMAVAAIVSGITEKLIFSLNGKVKPAYSAKPAEAILANLLGLLAIVQGLVVAFIVTRASWKRQPLPEEEQFTLGSSNSDE